MLFDNNDFNNLNTFLNIPSNEYYNYAYDYKNNQDNIIDEDKGFLKGNMFKNEYEPYKNYTYIIPKIKNVRERDLFKIMELSFMINDYNLYLDLHPDDSVILNKLKMASDNLEMYTKEYESKYGPLEVQDVNGNTFTWIESPWPWESEDGKYV